MEKYDHVLDAFDSIVKELEPQSNLATDTLLENRILALEKEIADLKAELENRPTLGRMYAEVQQAMHMTMSMIKLKDNL